MSYMLLDTRTMILAQRNGLTVRLALTPDDVKAAQRLRYCIFYEELSARPCNALRTARLDQDSYDTFCDHLLVVQENATSDDGTRVRDGRLVGTYRLLRQDVATRHIGFYSQREFDLSPLLARHPDLKFLELGRSCVAEGFRDKPVAELLWQGIWNYVRFHKLDVMLGCASLPGVQIDMHANALAFLAHSAQTPNDWKVDAWAQHRVDMKCISACEVDPRSALRCLPTLVKAYMRLGCFFGDGAVIDHQFDTTDILIVLPVSAINPRYFNHYGSPDAGHHLPTS